MSSLRKSLILILAAGMSGCSLMSAKDGSEVQGVQTQPRTAEIHPKDEAKQETLVDFLTEDIVYNILAGEIALMSLDLDAAYTHLYKGSIVARDPESAERAARVAMHDKHYADALKAVQVWIRLQPDNPTARQFAVLVLIRLGKPAEAIQHLKAIIRGHATEDDRFMYALGSLIPDQQPAEALDMMRRLTAEYPDDPSAIYALAATAAVARDWPLAEQETRRLLSKSPRHEKGLTLLAKILVAQNKPADALATLEAALAANPKNVSLRELYAQQLSEVGRDADAYKQFLKLREAQPDDEKVNFALGILALRLEQNDVAKAHFRRLIKLGKRSHEAAFYLGLIAEEAKDFNAAEGWFRKVGEGDRQVDATGRLARILAKRGRLTEAREVLRDLRNAEPREAVKIYILEADLLAEYEKPAVTLALYDAALREFPEEPDLLYDRAMFAVTQNDLVTMERDLRRVLAADPEHADALNALGYTLADRTNRLAEALVFIQRALEQKPDSGAVMDSMGWLQYRLGNKEEALKWLQRAIIAMPDPEVAAHLGEVLWALDRKDEARKVWNDALKEHKDNEVLRKTMERLTR